MLPIKCWSSSIFRVFACGLALVEWYLGMFEPRSIFSVLAATDDGYRLLWLTALFGAIGLFDVLVNDFTPAHVRFDPTLTHRHFILCAIAFCYVAQVFNTVLHVNSTGLTIYLLWSACLIVIFAITDAHKRHKDAKTCLQLCG